MYEYHARIDESNYPAGAYDGDTIDLIIDVGFRITTSQRIRLLGIDTPELRGIQKEAGIVARDQVRQWLRQHSEGFDFPLIVRTEKDDAFGRYLAEIVSRRTGQSLTDYLRDLGYPEWER